MKITKYLFLIVVVCLSFESFCQSPENVEMADVLRRDGKIYTVVLGVTIILTAVIVLLIRVDRKLFKMERNSRKSKSA
ncbi:MAG: CcmD family protein [Bacteroidota bacterium]